MKKRAFGKLYNELLYIPKHEKVPEKVFSSRMLISLITIVACAVAMIVSTFALFYSEVSTNSSTISGAYYSLSVSNAEDGKYICPLLPEDKHVFEIATNGTASTGYCKIQVGEDVHYTRQITHDTPLTLTIYAIEDTQIIFTPQWGISSNYTAENICGDKIVHSITSVASYTVEPTARLSSIAEHYGVSEENILIYNNISADVVAVDSENTAPFLTVGMELKIPNPAENIEPYTVPYSTYVVEPTASLDAISAHYGISIEDIIAFNDMTTYGVGMSLKIPNADSSLPDYSVPYAMYIVEPTATLTDIAAHYGVSEADILSFNNISEISVKLFLKIPGVAEDVISYTVPFATYTVEENATIEGISAYYGISVFDIATYNGFIDMSVGNIINIPGVSPETPSYVAPIPEPPSNTDENIGNNISDENPVPPVAEDVIPDSDIGVGDMTVQEPEDLAVFYPVDDSYALVSESTIKLSTADILLYKGHKYETIEGYQKELDLRITGIEAVSDIENKQGEFFCKLLTKAEKISLCIEITENIEEGYLKIIIGESEYYTVQIKKGAYIRLDIVAPIGTEISFEAYEGVSHASINEYSLYGDNIKDSTDGNNSLLDHTWMMAQIDEPVAPDAEENEPTTDDNTASDGETTPTDPPAEETPEEETPGTDNPTEENPETDIPTEENPETDISTEETPETDIPTEETPEDNTSTGETPEDDTPTEETPEKDTPTEVITETDSSIEETPSSEKEISGGDDNGGEQLTEGLNLADENTEVVTETVE